LFLSLKCQKNWAQLCGSLAGARLADIAGGFFATGLATFPGLVGGGVGQQSVACGGPAGSGVGQVADDEGGFLVIGVVGGTDGLVFRPRVLGAALADPGGA
jgi:hypothetical protein